MKIKYFLLCCLFSYQSMAAVPFSTDSSIHPKPWKLSQQQFIEQYGNNDTSKALINFYFLRNKRAKQVGVVMTGLGLLTAIGIAKITTTSNHNNRAYSYAFLLALGLAMLGFAIGMVILFDILILLRFSRKNLYKILQNYSAGKPFPRWLRIKNVL